MTQLLRKLHKWVSLLLGVQVLLWLLSGLVISLLDPAKVSGTQWMAPVSDTLRVIPNGPVLGPDQLPLDYLSAALAIKLVEREGKPVYRIRYAASELLLDASDGTPISISREEAETLAMQDFTGKGEIVSVMKGQAPDRETRKHGTAYWKIDFADDAATTLYISMTDGAILERRNRYWRLHDFFWGLHIMDYSGREDLNNLLVVSVAFVASWLGLSGFLLLFSSFTRRDFRIFKRP